MVLKIISATEARTGTNVIIDGIPCVIKKIDVSKTGKHGSSKVRVEASGLINGSKKIFVVPGHEKLEVPMVDKRKAQVLSIDDGNASVMDMESFETIEVMIPQDLKESIEVNSNVEYWDIEGQRIIKRKL